MQFYEKYLRLCANAGKSPSAAAEAVGLSRSVVVRWKSGSIPGDTTMLKLADLFGVPLAALTDDQISYDDIVAQWEKERNTADDAELQSYLEELKTRPEMRMLFSLAAGATKEDVERAVRVIEALRGVG